jgi:thioredoxin 1
MGNVVEITNENFEEEVLKSKGLVVVDFAAEWCGPCKRLAPIMTELAKSYDGKVKIAHLDVDNAQEIASQFGIMSVPTIVFFKDGKKIKEDVGLVPKQKLEETINANL